MEEKMINTIYVDFVGQDYSPIQDAVETARVYTQDHREIHRADPASSWIIDDLTLCNVRIRAVLEKYLQSVDINKLIINKSDYSSRLKIWDSNFGEGYFCGIVGVINGQISMTASELGLDFEEESEYVFKIHLQIQSRLDTMLDKDGNVTPGKPYFLAAMLLGDLIKLSDNTVPNNEDEIFDYLLMFWFSEQLQRAYLKGFYRTYRRFENNDDRLKGSIDIARHIKLNMGQNNGRVAYSYRENTVNNYLNHMIVMAYEHLKNKYHDLVMDNIDNNFELKSIIDHLKTEIGYSGYSSYEIISKNLQTIGHPYYTEYEELRQTCMKILRDEGISIFNGNDSNESNGILAYLPDLWEKYLESNIRLSIQSKDYSLETQMVVKVLGYDNGQSTEYKQETRPDFVFKTKDNQSFMIWDAKFKPKWDAVFEKGSISEVLSDYDKCLRDMVDIGGFSAGIIFPTNKTQIPDQSIIVHKISEMNILNRFYTIPVNVPYSNNTYSDWNSKMTESIGRTMGILENIILEEKNFYGTIMPYLRQRLSLPLQSASHRFESLPKADFHTDHGV